MKAWQWFEEQAIEPAVQILAGVARSLWWPGQRLSVPFVLLALVVALGLFWRRRRSGGPGAARSFAQFLELRAVYLSSSAILDYAYYVASAFVQRLFVAPLWALLLIPSLANGELVAGWLRGWLGPVAHPLSPSAALSAAYGLLLVVVIDFVHYWVHRMHHGVGFLWEFHKTHHSATALVPATVARLHPVEVTIEQVMGSCVFALTSGLAQYLCGGELKELQILGVNYVAWFSNCLAANLRHSHIWLSFGRFERILSSPAQHQIHHSVDPAHHNKNFAIHFSLFDWMFGTLHVTSRDPEPLVFGLGGDEERHYASLAGLLLYPFRASARALFKS